MVIKDDPNATGACLDKKSKDSEDDTSEDSRITATCFNDNSEIKSSDKLKLNNLSKFLVKDILNILESKEKKGKTKLKEIRRKLYDYIHTTDYTQNDQCWFSKKRRYLY